MLITEWPTGHSSPTLPHHYNTADANQSVVYACACVSYLHIIIIYFAHILCSFMIMFMFKCCQIPYLITFNCSQHSISIIEIWNLINRQCSPGSFPTHAKEKSRAGYEANTVIMHSITSMVTIFNNHPYSSKFVPTVVPLHLCRDGCWIMWLCYGVHITVCMHVTSCLCTLSASAFLHWVTHPYIS